MAEQFASGSSAPMASIGHPLATVIPLADIMREQAEADRGTEAVDTKPKEILHDQNGKQHKQPKQASQPAKEQQPKRKQHKPKKDKAARHLFDPASFAPKILAKRTEQPSTDAQQPTQQPPHQTMAASGPPAASDRSPSEVSKVSERALFVGERTLFVPSPAFSTAAKREQRDLTATKASRRTDSSRAHSSRTTATRTTSPAIASTAVPALAAATQPIRLFTPSMRPTHHDQLQALLCDSREFYVVAAIGMQRTGKSHVLNECIRRQGGWKGFVEADAAGSLATSSLAGPSGAMAGRVAASGADGGHATSGVDVIVTPERLFYIDTQPLLSPSIAEALQREERDAVSHSSVVFNAQVAADMFDIQLPLLLLCLTHTLLVTVNWPIPPALVSHMQLVFGLFSTLSSTLLPRSSHSCHVVLLINRAQETSADSPYSLSPHQLQQQVDTLFASSLASFTASGHVDVFLLPAKERGSLYDSSVRLLAAKLWCLAGRMKSQTGREREREWGRRLGNVYNALVHSSTMREQRKEVETRLSNQRPAQHNTTVSVFNQLPNTAPHHQSHSSHSSGQQRSRGSTGRDGSGGGMIVPPSLYQRDSPATSHQKLYQPP